MAYLSKNLVKSLSNLRLVTSSTLNNLFSSSNSKLINGDEEMKRRLLLKRFEGSPIEGLQYYSPLSSENFSPTEKICFPLFEDFKVVAGSCLGLVCSDNVKGDIVLWNPSTREVKIIPSSGNMHKGFSFSHMRHSFASGFGYDYYSRDFKLVRFITKFDESRDYEGNVTYDTNKSMVEMYSLKTDSWKLLDFPLCFVPRKPSVHIDGFYYWLAYGTNLTFILSFDFATEEFYRIALPQVCVYGDLLHFDLVDFEGSVGVIVYPKLGNEKSFELWLCCDGKSWAKEFDIRVPGADRPLGFWNKNRFLFFQGINGQLMVYDMTTEVPTYLDIFDYPQKMQLIPYVESAVSIEELRGSGDAFPIPALL